MTKDELFRKNQADMPLDEVIKLARKEVSKLCKTGGKSLTMSVPPMITDTDMIICETVRRLEKIAEINKNIKTGIELIAEERKEQIEKHFNTVENDVERNNNGQLIIAVKGLLQEKLTEGDIHSLRPTEGYYGIGWDKRIWFKMMKKTYIERLIIAGAFIAAEIDRRQNV